MKYKDQQNNTKLNKFVEDDYCLCGQKIIAGNPLIPGKCNRCIAKDEKIIKRC